MELVLSVTRGTTKIVPSFIEFDMVFFINYTILQNQRMWRCWAAPPYEAFFNAVSKPNKLYSKNARIRTSTFKNQQQRVFVGNLTESLNPFEILENALISLFTIRFSRNDQFISHFVNFKDNFKLLKSGQILPGVPKNDTRRLI